MKKLFLTLLFCLIATTCFAEQYAIGIIIQDTDTLTKVKSFFNKAKNLLEIQYIPDEENNLIEKSVLKAKPGAEIVFFIGIAPKVSKKIKDLLGVNDDGIGDYYLPNVMSMEFRGQDYSYDEMQRRLKQFIGEQWMGHYLILDSGSTLIDLQNKFINYADN